MFKHFFLLFAMLFSLRVAIAQPIAVDAGRAHSHNDYEQAIPLGAAWRAGFGSIEADIFLENGELLVSHDSAGLSKHRSFDSLYIQPLLQYIKQNAGYIYADTAKHLQLMLDLKTAAIPTLTKLVTQLQQTATLLQTRSLQVVISGNRPDPGSFSHWPEWLHFDGELGKSYTADQWKRIPMVSGDFKQISSWNGKGRLPASEQRRIDSLVTAVHHNGKKIRLWNAPDILNSWDAYLRWGVDYINTDHIEELSKFLKQYSNRNFWSKNAYALYLPKYRNDGESKKIRNVILLIGDGTGLAQWYSGYTANHAALNVFQMKYIGLSKTSSADSYITDSAPGATAFSAGKKTNNRAVGVDPDGKPFPLLPQLLKVSKMKTGIITSGDLRDATPAAFYGHQSERSQYNGMIRDLIKAPVDLVMGSCRPLPPTSLFDSLRSSFDVFEKLEQLPAKMSKPILLADTTASMHLLDGRADWSANAFAKAINLLQDAPGGFFLMLEGAQIDHGGHANNLPWAVSELLDFDRVIGKAMAFADQNGETLVIVTGDHETGGLSLTGGDFKEGRIQGQFSTGDHTAIPVPVFAYGPGAQYFSGVYENTAIYHKILEAMKK